MWCHITHVSDLFSNDSMTESSGFWCSRLTSESMSESTTGNGFLSGDFMCQVFFVPFDMTLFVPAVRIFVKVLCVATCRTYSNYTFGGQSMPRVRCFVTDYVMGLCCICS